MVSPYIYYHYLNGVERTKIVLETGNYWNAIVGVKSDITFPNAWCGFYDKDTGEELFFHTFKIKPGEIHAFGHNKVTQQESYQRIIVKIGNVYPVVRDSMEFLICNINDADRNTFWSMGDCDRNGTIGYDDFMILAAAYGSHCGDPGFDARADFDSDCDVDSDDYFRLSGNYGKDIWSWKDSICN